MNWKLNDVKKLTNNKWLNLYEANYINNKKDISWAFASRRNIEQLKCKKVNDFVDSIAVIPRFVKDNEEYLIMCKEFRLPINDYVYSFPAGLVEKDEDLETTAKREVMEEIGAKITNIQRLTDLCYNSEGMTDENVVIFLADVNKIYDQNLQDSEDIERVIVKVSDLKNFMQNKIFSAKASIFCTMYYKLYEQKMLNNVSYRFIKDINSYIEVNLKNGSMDEFWIKKINPVIARKGNLGEEITTYTMDGTVEVKNKVKANKETGEVDYVVTNSFGECYVVDYKTFNLKYQKSDKDGVYIPKSNPIRAVRLNENIEFETSFNKLFKVKKDDYLIIPYNRNVYGITKESMYENYTFVKD